MKFWNVKKTRKTTFWNRKSLEENLEKTHSSPVCIKHFAQDLYYLCLTIFWWEWRARITAVSKLTDNAYPSYFPNLSLYLSLSVSVLKKIQTNDERKGNNRTMTVIQHTTGRYQSESSRVQYSQHVARCPWRQGNLRAYFIIIASTF